MCGATRFWSYNVVLYAVTNITYLLSIQGEGVVRFPSQDSTVLSLVMGLGWLLGR